MAIQLLVETPQLRPGDYSLHPAEETRLVMSGLARRLTGPAPQLHPPQVSALRIGYLPAVHGHGGLIATALPGSTLATVAEPLVHTGAARLLAVAPGGGTGTFTVHDGIDAEGPVVAGPLPVTGLGEFRLETPRVLHTGCFVDFSDAGSAYVWLDPLD